jgi:hypothetical protein
MTKLFSMLKPYHQHLAREYAETARPPNRHPALMYAGDEILHELKYEYLYGSDSGHPHPVLAQVAEIAGRIRTDRDRVATQIAGGE